MSTFSDEFLDNCRYRLDESLRMILICLNKLDEKQVWTQPGPTGNSIGNLILHLCGNIRQYGISGLGNLEDHRNRDLEFEQAGGLTKRELYQKLTETIDEARVIMAESSEQNWLQHREVQGFRFSGVGLILHIVEHLSYHTGQIALITKLFLDQPLGFYDGINLNTKNK